MVRKIKVVSLFLILLLDTSLGRESGQFTFEGNQQGVNTESATIGSIDDCVSSELVRIQNQNVKEIFKDGIINSDDGNEELTDDEIQRIENQLQKSCRNEISVVSPGNINQETLLAQAQRPWGITIGIGFIPLICRIRWFRRRRFCRRFFQG